MERQARERDLRCIRWPGGSHGHRRLPGDLMRGGSVVGPVCASRLPHGGP